MKRLRRWFDFALPLVASIVLASALNAWVQLHPARLDLTSGEIYSISPETRAVLQGLRQPVRITFFHDTRSRAMQDARYLLEQYQQGSAQITLVTHDPLLEPAAAQKMRVQFAGTAVFDSGARRVTVNEATEVGFTNALIRVTSAAVGRICFSDGHVESNPQSLQTHDHFEDGEASHDHASGGHPLTLHERHGMGMAKNALETLGFAVEQRLLLNGPDSLDGCSVLVVASPQQPFTTDEVATLRSTLREGRPVLLMLEPGVDSGLGALLGEYGIALSTSVVRDPTRHYWTDAATPAVTDHGRHRITRQLALTFFPGAVELSPVPGAMPDDLVVTPLAETSADAVLADDPDGERRARTLMLEATRAGRAGGNAVHERFIVIGDGDFATNSFYGALGNGQLFLNTVSHLAEQDALVDIAPRDYAVAQLRLSNTELRATFLLTTVVAPLLMLSVGAWQWWRRRQAG